MLGRKFQGMPPISMAETKALLARKQELKAEMRKIVKWSALICGPWFGLEIVIFFSVPEVPIGLIILSTIWLTIAILTFGFVLAVNFVLANSIDEQVGW